ncbi:MAG: aminotransferase class I/II-fold pyridoxal phosphate-dependent enzyme [Candidatus Aegiribacteria sp.]|nr:aminotransferase class I/II-fold pyridoxal phosphate-dependent enzyme [Candidatus Aegiribacteria sp.]
MIRLAKPSIPEVAINNVREIFKSGDLVQGKYVKEFETALQKYLNTSNSIIVSSGTAALHLCLMALGIKEGDEVIVPAFTFPATANVIEIVGAVPVLVDISFNDYCLNVSRIISKITDKTKAIIPVHEFGQSADIEPIMQIARKYNLMIIEDAACALGTEYNGKKAGTFGNVGCYSFHPRKAITTGEGGLIVTDDRIIADKVRALRNHGISDTNDFTYAGLNYRMTDFQAAIGLAQMDNIEKAIENRIEMAHSYDKLLENCDYIRTPDILPIRRNIYQTYHILLDEIIDRDKLIVNLRDNGVQTNFGAHALHCLTYFREKYGYEDIDFPISKQAYKNGLALPLGDHLKNEDIKFIVEKLKMI